MNVLPTGSPPDPLVLDAWAMLAYFLVQPEAPPVRNYLRQAVHDQARLYISAINVAEVFYMTWRKKGRSKASQVVRVLGKLPLTIVPATLGRALRAAEIKAQYSSAKAQFSLADAFATALAEELGCPVVTGDPEFKLVETLVSIQWLRTPHP